MARKRPGKGPRIISFAKKRKDLNLKEIAEKVPKVKRRHSILIACESDMARLKQKILVEKNHSKKIGLQIEFHDKVIEWHAAVIAFFKEIPRDSSIRQVEEMRKRVAGRIGEARQAIEKEKEKIAALEKRKNLIK